MGAEALSRGAGQVFGIEQASRACGVIAQNWRQVATSEQTIHIIRGDVVKKLPTLQGQQFDRIYFDPPYVSNLYQPVIAAIAQYDLLAPEGEMAVEHSGDYLTVEDIDAIAQDTHKLAVCRHKHYGNTDLTFLSRIDDLGSA
jgi:16S rRNA (guanine(966)-N(2))-methyltransferase RsmD